MEILICGDCAVAAPFKMTFNTTGTASEVADGYQMVAWESVYITDELPRIGTVTAVSVSGSSTGRAAGDVREKGGLLLRQTDVYLKVIQVLYFMKGLA